MRKGVTERALSVIAWLALVASALGHVYGAGTRLASGYADGLFFLPALAGLIVVTTLIFRAFHVRRWSISFFVGHLAFILLLVSTTLPRNLEGSNAASWWFLPIMFDLPISIPLFWVPRNRLLWTAFLAVFGSLQYALIGWRLKGRC